MKKLSNAMTKALVAMGERVWVSRPSVGDKTWWNAKAPIPIADNTMCALHDRGLVKMTHRDNSQCLRNEAQLTDAGRKLAAEIAANHIGETNDMA